jgi:hypothetical protein
MATAAIQDSMHLQPADIHLHEYLTVNPKELEKENSLKSTLWNIATIVNFIAIITLTTTALGFSSFLASAVPAVLALTLVAIPLLCIPLLKMNQWSEEYGKEALMQREISQEISRLENLDEKAILSELEKIGIDLTKTRTNLPSSLSISRLTTPLAFYNFYLHTHTSSMAYFEKEISSEIDDENARASILDHAYSVFENISLKAKVLAANAFHVLQNPNTTFDIADIGRTTPKSFERRHLIKTFDKKSPYFVFANKPESRALSVEDVNTLSIKDLSTNIFGIDLA